MINTKQSIEHYLDSLQLTYHLEDFMICPTNDVIFKFMLTQNSPTSQFLRNSIIHEVLGISVKETHPRNTEIIPAIHNGKRVILDVLLQDEYERLYNLEMQMTRLRDLEQLRFQDYASHLSCRQLESGDPYTKKRPIYQIIFIDDVGKYPDMLLQRFQLYDDKNNTMVPFSVTNIIFVYLPVINLIASKKTFPDMSILEKICYIYKNGVSNEIIQSKERVVKAFLTLYMEIRENRELWTLADALEKAKKIDLTHEIVIRAEGRAEGRVEGRMEGRMEGKIEGKEEGKAEGVIELLYKLIKIKYDVDGLSWLRTLDFEELQNVSQLLLTCDTFNQLKLLVK